MGTADSNTDGSVLGRVVEPLGRSETYRHLLYLLLTVPLGVVYFVVVTLGLLLGLGLSITVFGIPLLVGVILGSRYVVAFERMQLRLFLDHETPTPTDTPTEGYGFLSRIQIKVYAGSTWKGILYLYAKTGFAVVVTVAVVAPLLAGSVAVAAPLIHFGTGFDPQLLGWRLDGALEAVVLAPVGAVLVVVAVFLSDVLTTLWIDFSTMLLGRDRR